MSRLRSDLAALQVPEVATGHQRRSWLPLAWILWGLVVLALIILSVMVHNHPKPWPVDLQTTITLQHLQMPSWLSSFFKFVSVMNDPVPTVVMLVILFIVFCLFRKFLQGVAIFLGTLTADGLDSVISNLVARPRPQSPLIHVYIPEPFHSFPSGHTENNVVFYGFLLFLSLTPAVRAWKYYKYLLPLQILALLPIALIGFSRILEGAHWFTDVIGGYLSGSVFLFLLIMLYRQAEIWLTRFKEKRKHSK